jgi:hypothetical protein
MGLDLTLAPENYPSSWWLTFDRIRVDRDYRLYSQIAGLRGTAGYTQVCNPRPIPSNVKVQWYEDEGIKERKTDPYGSPLTYLTAGELLAVALPTNASPWNKGVWAFLKELPPDTRILLWWH